MKISLPASTLDAARSDLSDLRIIGPAGTEVPFVIETPTRSRRDRQAAKSFRVELLKFATQLTIETGTSRSIDRISLSTPARDFVKAARLEVSASGTEWELAGDGFQLARQPGLDAVSVPLGALHAAFVRITIDDSRTDVIPFTGAVLDLLAADSGPVIPIESRVISRDEFAQETVLTIDLSARHLPLASMEIATTEPLFARVVSVTQNEMKGDISVERGAIFRSRLPNQPMREHLGVPLDFKTGAKALQLHVHNGNDSPLSITAVRFSRRPIWLIVPAQGAGTYQLLTGNARATTPRYDLAQFAGDWKDLRESTVAVSAAASNPGYQWTDVLGNAPVVGSTLDVSAWRFKKNVVTAEPGVHELELDMEVLARAERNFADLRLMQGDRQIPYLLERTPLRRSIALEPLPQDNPKQPQLSRWTMVLPFAALPVQRINLASSTRLFSRVVQVYETIPDARGEPVRHVLSSPAGWSSRPEQENPKLMLDLIDTPRTDTLYLETDNGDNPAIALVKVSAEYPVVRLLFRAEAGQMQFYYGNDAVPAPRYDLGLVASELLNEDRTAATLGREEPTNPSKRAFRSSPKGGVMLWSSLALVVGALLFAIARLLPKPPAD
ncbi:MAG: hypothetical protein ABIZ04_17525 [Opitutus sp.]